MASAGAHGVVLALLFIAQVSAGKYRGQSEVKKGQAFNVTCMVAINEGVAWTKDGKNLTKELGPFTIDERKINDSVEATLTVKKAKSAHTGTYQCNKMHAGEQHAVRVAAETTVAGVYDEADGNVRYFDLYRTFNLTCNIKTDVQNFAVTWLKEGLPLTNFTATELAKRYRIVNTANTSSLVISAAKEDDYGNYTCSVQEDATGTFEARANPLARLPANSNVVEGQKTKLACAVHGKPRPTVSWLYDNGTGLNVSVVETERLKLDTSESGVEEAVLSIADAVPNDYGQYYCVAEPQGADRPQSVAGTTLRVKDKYAALWPFIGICAEVCVLCAIILVYEKRRSKNVEMEDSDTDQHDQKKS